MCDAFTSGGLVVRRSTFIHTDICCWVLSLLGKNSCCGIYLICITFNVREHRQHIRCQWLFYALPQCAKHEQPELGSVQSPENACQVATFPKQSAS